MTLPLLILGAGGHARVLIDALRAASATIAGIAAPSGGASGAAVLGVPIVGDDSHVTTTYPRGSVMLVNGVGSVGQPGNRVAVYEAFKRLGYSFATVIHPRATVAPDVVLGEGVQIMAGAIIQPGVSIGANTIVNTGAIVDHDCRLGGHVHISPGATLCGGVVVGGRTHVGSAATVIQGVAVGSCCRVGAGAVVVTAVADNATVMGVPARDVTRRDHGARGQTPAH